MGVHITEDLTWNTHTGEGKAEPIPPQAAEEIQSLHEDPSILLLWSCREHPNRKHHCLVGNSTAQDRRALQRVVRLAERTTGITLPSLQD